MKLKLFLCSVLSLLFLANTSYGQDYGEKWIVSGQKYYKIKTASDGMYRIGYQDLINAGFAVNAPGFDKRKIQMYHRGQEQAIFISGAIDGVINSNEFIEFYGTRNDGTLDASMYRTPDLQSNPYYNLYSDTTAYFLTYAFGSATGKRMEVRSAEFNSNGLPKEIYHLDEKLIVNSSLYSEGQYYPPGGNSVTLLADFDSGEGWTGDRVQKPGSINYTISNATNVVSGGPKPVLEVMLIGRNNRRHNINLSAGSAISSLHSIKDLEFEYYNKSLISEAIEFSDISAAGKVELKVLVNGYPDNNTDNVSVSYYKLTYPQTFSLTGVTSKVFNIASNAGGKSYVEFTNFNPTSIVYDITDQNNIKRLNYFISGSTANTVIDGTEAGRKLLVVINDYKTALASPVVFRPLSTTANHIIVGHSTLRKPVDAVKAFAEYRASAAGGSYDTLTVDVEQLYNQFTYGEITPLAIRRFADYMLNYGNPKYLLLLGKALKITENYNRKTEGYNINKDLVPTAGFPGSDVLFTSHLKGAGNEPAIATGRVSARTSKEVLNYLNKVKEMESETYDDLWHKNLVHLSGGLHENEGALFRSYVKDFEVVARDKYLGGSVKTISKNSTLNVEFINIAEQVNNGLNLITFFGHSSPDITDIEIGKVSDEVNGYNNKGKYPMIYVNGCSAGDIFSNSYSVGEDWILAENKGAIAYFAYSDLAYAGPLKRFGDEFYSTLYGDSIYINKGIGEVHQETIRRFLNKYSPTELYLAQSTQMILQGDPAYKLFKSTKADYQTNDQQIYIHSYDGQPITALSDSFALAVAVKNLGRVVLDSTRIQVKRTYSSGSEVLYDTILTPVFYEDTIFINIKSRDEASFGLNKFEVTIDPADSIKEMNETNNVGRLEYFIPLSKIFPLQPNEYSIVNTSVVNLIAQSTEIAKGSQQYIFEVDTSYLFNGPIKKQQIVTSETIPSWKVDLSVLGDSVTYYWRVKLNNNDPSNLWSTSSFTYIKNGPEGWTQQVFPQLLKDPATNIDMNIASRKLEFRKVESKISVRTFGNNASSQSYLSTLLKLNDFAQVFEGRCGNNMLLAVAFNKVTAEPYLLFNKAEYNSGYYCGRAFNEIANRFSDATITATKLEDYINKLPTGDKVLLFSSGLVNYESWPSTTKAKLQDIGVDLTKFNLLKNGYPYIVFGQKGAAPGTATQILPNVSPPHDPYVQDTTYENTVTGQFDRGNFTSTLIGPALAWGTLYKKATLLNPDDAIDFDLIGVDNFNNEYVLASKIQKDTLDISFINEKQFPHVKIRANMKDSVNLTPPRLVRWQVNYTGAPEGVAYLAPGQKLDSLKFDEGQEFSLSYVFKNISNKDFPDSIVVEHTLNNTTSRLSSTINQKYKPLAQYDSIPFTLKINTLGKAGINSVQTYVNPKLQIEQNYFNNILSLNNLYTVNKDNTNPILDVVFDGIHIMDGDIVSPSPLINISLKDENKYKFKKDTAGVEVFVKKPCEACTYERIAFSDPNLKWQPSDATNKFKIEYQPQNLANGKYNLLVQGTDDSGNKSGVLPYSVNFEVINESTVTNFYPYPNPFSTKTRFVFTVTGREIPDDIRVLVMTISGKVVREISKDELGPMKIGNNISDFFWDGTDQFGDKLANGVYLYKVTVKKNGVTVDHRDTAGDKGFHKGFGKMYILR